MSKLVLGPLMLQPYHFLHPVNQLRVETANKPIPLAQAASSPWPKGLRPLKQQVYCNSGLDPGLAACIFVAIMFDV